MHDWANAELKTQSEAFVTDCQEEKLSTSGLGVPEAGVLFPAGRVLLITVARLTERYQLLMVETDP